MINDQARPLNRRPAKLVLGGMAIVGILIGVASSSGSQTPAGDIAAQVRSQGYGCHGPISAVRKVRGARPDSTLWVLKCRNAAYTVRLDPDMAAHISKLKR